VARQRFTVHGRPPVQSGAGAWSGRRGLKFALSAKAGLNDRFDCHFLEPIDIRLGQSKLLERRSRQRRGSIRRNLPQAGSALNDGAMEQSLCGGHRQQRGHLPSTTGLPEDHHGVRIAAELGDVVAHPAQRRDDVHHADVARRGELLTAGFLERREAEDIEAVIDGHDDDVTALRQMISTVNASDAAGYARLYATSATITIYGGETISGRDAIENGIE